jgi:hypothetical protein
VVEGPCDGMETRDRHAAQQLPDALGKDPIKWLVCSCPVALAAGAPPSPGLSGPELACYASLLRIIASAISRLVRVERHVVNASLPSSVDVTRGLQKSSGKSLKALISSLAVCLAGRPSCSWRVDPLPKRAGLGACCLACRVSRFTS